MMKTGGGLLIILPSEGTRRFDKTLVIAGDDHDRVLVFKPPIAEG